MIQGQLRADAAVLMNIQIDIVQRRVTAKFALVSTSNGQTYGTSEMSLWSNNTREQLSALLVAMEQDIRDSFFTDGQDARPRSPTQNSQNEADVEGLGELYGTVQAL
jgi:hypothetical protein